MDDLGTTLLSNPNTGAGRLVVLVKAVVAVLAAILFIATVCASWPLVPQHMGARWSVNPEPVSLAAAGDECYRILLDGIRNRIQTETGSSNQFEARAKLMQVDDHYSYHDYQRDYSKAHSSSSEMDEGGKVSVSYNVFSTSAAGHYSTSGREMSHATFELKKKELLSQKHMLLQESSDAGASSESARVVSQTVSSQVVHAWEACQSFAQQNIKLTQTVNPNGDSIQVSLKYVLGDRPQGSTQTMLTVVDPSPKDKALCSIVDDVGRAEGLPIELIPGMVAHVVCHRQQDYMGRLSVTLGTNLEMHSVTVNFADVVTLKVAKDLEEEIAGLGRQFRGLQGEIAEVKNATLHRGNVMQGEIADMKNSTRLQIDHRVDGVQSKLADMKSAMDDREPLQGCAICPQCGGEYTRTIVSGFVWRRFRGYDLCSLWYHGNGRIEALWDLCCRPD